MENLFALCILEEGGELYLGEIPSFVQVESIDWVPIETEDYYSISVIDLLVNSESVEVPSYFFNTAAGSGSAVDSGTTELLLSQTVYNAFVAKVLSLCSEKNNLIGICDVEPEDSLFAGNCYEIDDKLIHNYPVISLVFNGGAILDVPPSAYLVQGLCGEDYPELYAVAIDPVEDRWGTILGDTFMKNRISIFDRVVSFFSFINLFHKISPCL